MYVFKLQFNLQSGKLTFLPPPVLCFFYICFLWCSLYIDAVLCILSKHGMFI